jgi:hypothetical protein
MLEKSITREVDFAMIEINDFDKEIKHLFTNREDGYISPSRQKARDELIDLSNKLYKALPTICWMTEQTMAGLMNVSRRQIQRAKAYLRLTGRIEVRLKYNFERSNFAHCLTKLDFSVSDRSENWPPIEWEIFRELSPQCLNELTIEEQLDIFEEMNLPFIPIHHVKFDRWGKPYCSCRWGKSCEDIGKHPIVFFTELDFSKKSTYREMKEYWLNSNDSMTDVGDNRNNIAFLTGAFSVIDVDRRHFGHESLRILEEFYGQIPKDLFSRTGDGFHFYIADRLKSVTKFLGFEGIDVRGSNSYIIAPFSGHHSGIRYNWQSLGAPGSLTDDLLSAIEDFESEKDIVPAKTNGLEIKQSIPRAVLSGKMPIPKGTRSVTLFLIACSFRGRGSSFQEILKELSQINQNRCNPPLPEYKVREAAKMASKYRTNAEKRSLDMGLAP